MSKEADLKETLLDSLSGATLEEAEAGGKVLRNVVLIRPGVSKNRRSYSDAVLERDCQVFEGAPVYATNHRMEDKTVRTLVARVGNVRHERGVGTRGDLFVSPVGIGVVENALWAAQEFGAEKVGLSIDTAGRFTRRQSPGGLVQEVEGLMKTAHTSVDLVINPAAGGRLSESTAEEDEMLLERLAALTDADLAQTPPAILARLTEGVSEADIQTLPNGTAILERLTAPPPTTTVTVNTPTQTVTATPPPPAEDLYKRFSEQFDERVRQMECRQVLTERVAEARDLTPLEREFIGNKFNGRGFETKELDAEIARLRDLAGRAHPNRPNVPGAAGSVQVSEAYDRNAARLEATVLAHMKRPDEMLRPDADVEVDGKKVRPFTKISEALFAFHPELKAGFIDNRQQAAMESMSCFQWGGGGLQSRYDEHGHLRENVRLREDIITTTFAQAWADTMHRTLKKVVADPDLNTWRLWVSRIVSMEDFTRSYKVVRVGELGVFPTVAEAAPYQEVTAPTDDHETMTLLKKGGLLTITWEDVLADDINVLAKIPRDLGRAAAWTTHDYIYATILQANTGTGQTMAADSTVLYHSNHANIATSTFTDAALETVRIKMPKQTDPDSAKRKNYAAKYLLYQSPDLDRVIWESLSSAFRIPTTITDAGMVNVPNFIRQVLGLIPVPIAQYPTATTTRWELVADPAMCDTAAVGFLNGRADPDIFVQDQETVGSRFTADKITYKARLTVAATAIDYRAFSRGNV